MAVFKQSHVGHNSQIWAALLWTVKVRLRWTRSNAKRRGATKI